MSKSVNILGKRLKQARKAAGLTQQAAANAFGVQLRTYCRWEAGDTEPSLDTVISIAKTFNVTSDYLLGLTAEEPAE